MNSRIFITTLIGSKNPDDDHRACITYVRMKNSPDYIRTYSHYSSDHSTGPTCYGFIEENIEIAHAYGTYYGDAQAKLIKYWKSLSSTERQQKLKSVGIDLMQGHAIIDEINGVI
jgi:hypothetical protein